MNIVCSKNELIFSEAFFPTEGFVSQAHPLHVRALVIGQTEPFVLVSLEMTSLPDDEVTPLREAAAACAGTTAERVWITVTHTFSAPHLMPDHLLKTEKEKQNKAVLRSLLLGAVRKTIKDAAETAKDAYLTIRQGQSAVVCSRNIELPEGWWAGCGGADPADKTLSLLEAEAAGGDAGAAAASECTESTAKTPADCLTYKAADGRKRYEDEGNDILQRNKRVRPAAGARRIIRTVSRYKEAVPRDGTAFIFRSRPPGF